MAIQNIDRKKAQHGMKTAKRVVPRLVVRGNKQTVAFIAPHHVRESRYADKDLYGEYSKCFDKFKMYPGRGY